jgi:dynein heavy chain
MLMVKSSAIRDPEQLIKLWIHESSRVFHDRLINEQDRIWYQDLLIELLKRGFNSNQEKENIFGSNNIKFGDLLKLDSMNRDYEEIKDISKLMKVLNEKQDDFLEGKSLSKLIFFEEAIEHVLRIARVLRQPRGSAMLIGVGGSGKQSLTKLCSFMLDCENKSIEIVKGYNLQSFRDFIKILKQQTGVSGKQCTFLFTDSQIVNESFLEDINSLLNSGEVPNIWE